MKNETLFFAITNLRCEIQNRRGRMGQIEGLSRTFINAVWHDVLLATFSR